MRTGDENKDPAFNLTTGEVIYVEHNTKVYQNNGRLKNKSLISGMLIRRQFKLSVITHLSDHFTEFGSGNKLGLLKSCMAQEMTCLLVAELNFRELSEII